VAPRLGTIRLARVIALVAGRPNTSHSFQTQPHSLAIDAEAAAQHVKLVGAIASDGGSRRWAH